MYAHGRASHLRGGSKMAKFRKPTPKQVLHVSRFYLFLTILAFIRALSAYVFIVPNGFAPSGITGLSSLLYNMVTRLSDSATVVAIFDPSITAFVLNIPLFIACLLYTSDAADE